MFEIYITHKHGNFINFKIHILKNQYHQKKMKVHVCLYHLNNLDDLFRNNSSHWKNPSNQWFDMSNVGAVAKENFRSIDKMIL